jgi:hypothetical protein
LGIAAKHGGQDKFGLTKFHLSEVPHAPSINQKSKKSVIFQAPSDSIDGTEGERLSTNYHPR